MTTDVQVRARFVQEKPETVSGFSFLNLAARADVYRSIARSWRASGLRAGRARRKIFSCCGKGVGADRIVQRKAFLSNESFNVNGLAVTYG
jgi:hypothetical protein